MKSLTGRHEIKHYIGHADFLQLRARLPCVASPDKNAAVGSAYQVRSLYFDNYTDKALREKIDGVNKREKFRLRLYNGDPSFIKLEKKSKENGICYKNSARISLEQCEKILSAEYDFLRESEHPLFLELYTKLHTELLRPKNIVEYMREAYVYAPGNVRITMDYDIRAGLEPTTFLAPTVCTFPLPGANVLEVKYDAFLPEIIRGLVSLSSRQQTAFSKYAVTRII